MAQLPSMTAGPNPLPHSAGHDRSATGSTSFRLGRSTFQKGRTSPVVLSITMDSRLSSEMGVVVAPAGGLGLPASISFQRRPVRHAAAHQPACVRRAEGITGAPRCKARSGFACGDRGDSTQT